MRNEEGISLIDLHALRFWLILYSYYHKRNSMPSRNNNVLKRIFGFSVLHVKKYLYI